MNKLSLTLSLWVSLTCLTSQSWALPPCPSSGYFDNCYGSYSYGPKSKWEGDEYIGEWQNNVPHGQGIYSYKNKNKYVGQFKNSMKYGQGIFTWANGDKYIGEFKDKLNGEGSYTWSGGDKYVGEYKDGNQHGQGKYTYANGTIKEGIWKDNKFMYAKKSTSTSNPK